MSLSKTYITADELLLDSFRLGVQIHNSGFKPDFIVGVWRGGTPVGIAIQEILAFWVMILIILQFGLHPTTALTSNQKRLEFMA